MENKILYGLSNVYVWPITSTDSDGKPTYGPAIKVPGAVEFKLSTKGEISEFKADNVTYYQCPNNNGYDGEIKIAKMNEEFRTNILKETKDTNGVLVESADAKPAEFALGFQFEGDVSAARHVLFRTSITRPDVESKTKEDKIEPNTESLKITASPRLNDMYVKAYCEKDSSAYDTWFGAAPYEPVIQGEIGA